MITLFKRYFSIGTLLMILFGCSSGPREFVDSSKNTGKVIYPGIKPSSFEGEFQWFTNPYYNTKPFRVPKFGTYTSIFGWKYIGRYQYIHSPDSRSWHGINKSDGALLMIGEEIDNKGNKKTGVWHAMYYENKIALGFTPSSISFLKSLKEQSETNIKKEKAKLIQLRKETQLAQKQSQSSLGDFFSEALSIVGAVSTVTYGVNSGLTTDSAAGLGAGMYSLIKDGDASQLQQANNNIEFKKSSAEIQRELDADNLKQKYTTNQINSNSEYLAGVARSNKQKQAIQKGNFASTPTPSRPVAVTSTSGYSTNMPLTITKLKTTQPNPVKPAKKKTRTQIDLIRVEAMAYCYQKKNSGKWGCDGPNQHLIGTKSTIELALNSVICRSPNLNRNRAFSSNILLDSEEYNNGVLVYCGRGLNSYDRDIAKKYVISSSDKKARNTYKCRKNSLKICTILHERSNGLVDNFTEITVLVPTE